jgi:hypothetical protein
VRIASGLVDVITTGSDTLFHRTPSGLPMVTPTEVGDITLLKKYLCNLHPVTVILLTAWIAYTISLPKRSSSKFVHLQITGGQGSGKSSLCTNVLSKLIDPSRVVLRTMPRTDKDLAIATQNSHVMFIDNVRGITQAMSDIMCIAATGGAISSRRLYSDEEEHVINLHGALVITTLHPFIDQPDLAERFLPIETRPIPEDKRRSDTELAKELETDLPFIQRGIFDLMANIFVHLPSIEVEASERMIDFVRYLAAMEKAQGVPAGVYQREYRNLLAQGQREALHENVLAAAVIELVEGLQDDEWTGTPKELLNALNGLISRGTQRSREWPQNEIALTKRLRALEAGLKSQGISLEFGRNHQRFITITHKGG